LLLYRFPFGAGGLYGQSQETVDEPWPPALLIARFAQSTTISSLDYS